MNYQEYQQQVYETTLQLVEDDLIRLSSGNVSLRLPDGNAAITPSGILYSDMVPEDVVIIDLESQKVAGKHKPSSEKQLHTEIYKAREDINAVVHTHSRFAIAFASTGMELPVSNIEILAVGGPIPVAGYATPGTREVGLKAARRFTENPGLKALLLQNHGMVAVGKSIGEAYQNAYKAETGAEIHHLALQTGGEVQVLTPEQIEDIFARYKKPKEQN